MFLLKFCIITDKKVCDEFDHSITYFSVEETDITAKKVCAEFAH
jgi:hypothetical protein